MFLAQKRYEESGVLKEGNKGGLLSYFHNK